MNMNSPLQLNTEQHHAVHSPGDTLVIAGAGTGKTAVLISRIVSLVKDQHIPPRQILAITFTRKAATEMRDRLTSLLPVWQARQLTVSTFHSLLLRLLRSQGDRRRILCGSDQQRLVEQILVELNLSDPQDGDPGLLPFLTRLKSSGLSLNSVSWSPESMDPLLLRAVALYEARKTDLNMIDFDDILSLGCQCLQRASASGLPFRSILVDEFQDTNPLQFKILEALLRRRDVSVYAVGDPKQAIYRFRGTDCHILNRLKEIRPHNTIALTRNYRCSGRILALANHIVAGLPHSQLLPERTDGADLILLRPPNEQEEANEFVGQVRMLLAKGFHPEDLCFLFRSLNTSLPLLEILVEHGLPVSHYGRISHPMFQSPCKQILTLLSLLSTLPLQKKDRMDLASLLSIERSPLSSYIRDHPGMDLPALLKIPDLPSGARLLLKRLSDLDKDLPDSSPKELIRSIRMCLSGTDLCQKPSLRGLRQTRDNLALTALEETAGRFRTLESFLSFTEDLHAVLEAPSEDGIRLMTIHGAKGLQFPVVCLPGLVEGLLPHRSALDPAVDPLENHGLLPGQAEDPLEEERRLAYVAVTRAEDQLILSAPQTYRDHPTEVSRFIRDFFMPKN